MSDPNPFIAPVVTPPSSRTLLIHSGISIAVLIIVGTACAYFKVPGEVTATLIASVVTILIAVGLMTATSSAATQAAASVVTDQLNTAIQNLADKHAQNAQAIAVHDVQIQAVSAPPAPILNLMTEPATVIEPKTG
jgi:hypothetical protein